MSELTAARTLVKSPPELWAVCSDAESLGRHLEPFGEIKITRLEPETAVAWEGQCTSGTVRIEPSGWGTKVTLTAHAIEPEAVAEPEPTVAGEPEPIVTVEPEMVAPEPVAPETVAPEPVAAEPDPVLAVAELPVRRTPPPPAPTLPTRRKGGLIGKLVALFRPVPSPPAGESHSEWKAQTQSGAPTPSEAVVAERVPVVLRPDPVVVEPVVVEPVVVEPERVVAGPEPVSVEAGPAIDRAAALDAALDSLGQAHHRPYSRG